MFGHNCASSEKPVRFPGMSTVVLILSAHRTWGVPDDLDPVSRRIHIYNVDGTHISTH